MLSRRMCLTFLSLLSLSISLSCRDIKLLVLIISSDQFPVYIEEQRLWRSYMHSDPEHVEAYFLKGDPTLDKRAKIDGDIIWLRTDEGWIEGGSAGIINKTILGLEKLLPRFDEFDYILRTNLSSFYVFPRLLDFLKTLPPTDCYAGSWIGHMYPKIGAGSGFIISTDVARKLVASKSLFVNNKTTQDDVLIGNYIHRILKLKLIEHQRVNIDTIETWNLIEDALPDLFHFRLKNPDHLRATDELSIYTELIKRFYPEPRE